MTADTPRSTELISFLYQKRKPIVLVTAIAFAAAVVTSLLMTPYYKAKAIVFPTSLNSVSFQGNARSSVVEFGDEADAERLLQVLVSPEIRDSLTVGYQLYRHYDIDSSAKHAKALFQEEYESNVRFNRTRYNSIAIEVYDRDPVIATKMANDIVRLVDTAMNRMIRQRALGPMWAVQEEVRLIRQEMSDYSDRMTALNDSGVVNEETRSRLYADYLDALKFGKSKLAGEIKRKIDASQKYGSNYDLYAHLSEFFSLRYSDILDVNDQAREYARTNIQQTIRHSMAEVPDRKAKPRRSLLVITTTVAAFLLAIFVLLAAERIRELRGAPSGN